MILNRLPKRSEFDPRGWFSVFYICFGGVALGVVAIAVWLVTEAL